ncbi:hypothetical protein JCM8097_007475 [Rhodosporidiobolus ruineniae]
MLQTSTAPLRSNDASPELEFTFLRPAHQHRSLARPASAYVTSSPAPSRPTSPIPAAPPLVPTSSARQSLHATSPKPMRQGAPRLGGLGLGVFALDQHSAPSAGLSSSSDTSRSGTPAQERADEAVEEEELTSPKLEEPAVDDLEPGTWKRSPSLPVPAVPLSPVLCSLDIEDELEVLRDEDEANVPGTPSTTGETRFGTPEPGEEEADEVEDEEQSDEKEVVEEVENQHAPFSVQLPAESLKADLPSSAKDDSLDMDDEAEFGSPSPPSPLHTLDLSAAVLARAHLSALPDSPCRPLSLTRTPSDASLSAASDASDYEPVPASTSGSAQLEVPSLDLVQVAFSYPSPPSSPVPGSLAVLDSSEPAEGVAAITTSLAETAPLASPPWTTPPDPTPRPPASRTTVPRRRSTEYETLGLRLPSSISPTKRSSTLASPSSAFAPFSPTFSPPTSPEAPTTVALSPVQGDGPVEREKHAEEVANAEAEPLAAVAVSTLSEATRQSTTPGEAPVLIEDEEREQEGEPDAGEGTEEVKKTEAVGDHSPVEPSSASAAPPFVSEPSPKANEDTISAQEDVSAPSSSTPAEPAPAQLPSLPSSLPVEAGLAELGTAVAGALVMGGLAVGQSAWRGLSGWAWGGREAEVPAFKVVEVEEEAAMAAKGKEEEERKKEKEETMKGKKQFEAVPTAWGEQEFDAPEGFLDELQKAMEEIGPEDLAANSRADVDAQQAAYDAAVKEHAEAVEVDSILTASPTPADRTPVFPSTPRRGRSRPGSVYAGSVRRGSYPPLPLDADADELEKLLAPMWDADSSPSALSPPQSPTSASTRFGYSPPPGLSAGAPLSRVLSPSSSISTTRSPPSIASTSSPSPVSPGRSSRSLFRLGSKKESKPAKLQKGKQPPSVVLPSPPSTSGSSSTTDAAPSMSTNRRHSFVSLPSVAEDASTTSSTPQQQEKDKKARRRSFIFGLGSSSSSSGKDVPPVPPLPQYVDYANPSRRRASDTSSVLSSPGLAPSPNLPASRRLSFPSPTPGSPPSLSKTGRRSSLRSTSRFDLSPPTSSSLFFASSVPSTAATFSASIYRVRFANATGGLGLKRGGEEDGGATRWVNVGREGLSTAVGKTSEANDALYAEQAARIKKSWRGFGSERDWANVRID